jgi:hypothetical protein
MKLRLLFALAGAAALGSWAASCGSAETIPIGTGGGGATSAASTGATGGGSSASLGTGGQTTGGGSAGGGTSHGGGGAGGGGAKNSGDCDNDGDCPGSHCVAITPGGFRVCQQVPVEATSCTNPGIDDCCNTSDCQLDGLCLVGPVSPACVGPVHLPRNECGYDQCGSDPDCGAGMICVDRGLWGPEIKSCMVADCKRDTDCGAGEKCELIQNTCCSNYPASVALGLYCVPPVNGCHNDKDCDQGSYCALDANQKAVCTAGMATCPG